MAEPSLALLCSLESSLEEELLLLDVELDEDLEFDLLGDLDCDLPGDGDLLCLGDVDLERDLLTLLLGLSLPIGLAESELPAELLLDLDLELIFSSRDISRRGDTSGDRV